MAGAGPKIGKLPDARIRVLRRTSIVPGQDGPDIEEDEMYAITIALGADRIRDWHEQAARDRLVIQARRARREAAVEAGLRSRPWSTWRTRRSAAAVTAQRVPADATPDQWAAGLSMAAAQRADADDRQPVGGRAS
jgi:hypothetical protein